MWKAKSHSRESSGLKGKFNFDVLSVGDSKEVVCFEYGQKRHWKRSSCPLYLQEVRDIKGKVYESTSDIYSIEIHNSYISNSWILNRGCGFCIFSDMKGLKESE